MVYLIKKSATTASTHNTIIGYTSAEAGAALPIPYASQFSAKAAKNATRSAKRDVI